MLIFGSGMPIGWTVLLPVASGRGSRRGPGRQDSQGGYRHETENRDHRRRDRGLTAAVALARKGLAAEVYEQAPVLKEVGAGVGLWPNALTALAPGRAGWHGGAAGGEAGRAGH